MKEEEIRKRDVFNKYLELSARDVETFFKDETRFARTACPACGSDDLEKALSKNRFTYSKCRKCDTLFVNPRPPIDMFDAFYTQSPSTTFWVKDFFLPVAETRRIKIFKPRADHVAKFIGDRKFSVVGDIGAGFGLFLEELRKLTPNAKLVAIEPSVEMAEICRSKSLDVVSTMLESVEGAEQFDLLTSFELFEHIHDPRKFLAKIFDLLKPKGNLILTTLNGLGFDIQLLWEKSKSLTAPHHLNFFNPFSIRMLLESVGFSIVEISTPGVLDWDIVEGGLVNEGIDPGRFFQTVAKYGTPEAKESLQQWISSTKFSSHMRVVAQK